MNKRLWTFRILAALVLTAAAVGCSNSRPQPPPVAPPPGGGLPFAQGEPALPAYPPVPGRPCVQPCTQPPPPRPCVQPCTQPPPPPGGAARPQQPPQPPITIQSGSDQCATAFGRTDADWFPGLPFAPLQTSQFTGFADGDIQFSDGSRDHLMNLAQAQVEALSTEEASRAFAMQIDDVRAYTDIRSSGQVTVQLNVVDSKGRAHPVSLQGQIHGPAIRDRVNVRLASSDARYAGRITCADVNGGCESTLITIQQISREGQIAREAHIVHRFGSAHVVVAPQDQFKFQTIANPAHRTMAEYLANTVNNSCLAALYDVKTGQRQMRPCEVQRLQDECGKINKVKFPAAKVFAIRTWAVAFGRSGFEFAALDKETRSQQVQESARFLISGPLVISQARPMSPDELHVEGAIGIQRAHLIANDGGGNLNLQLIFAGEPKSHTRLNITTLFEDTRPELQGSIQPLPPK